MDSHGCHFEPFSLHINWVRAVSISVAAGSSSYLLFLNLFVICMDRVSRCTMGTAPTRLGVSCYPVRANISRSCSQVRVQQSMSLKGRLVQHQQVFILMLHWTTVVKGELSVKTKLYTIYFMLLVDFFISPRRSWRMFCLACCNKLPKNRLTVKRRHIDVFHCIQLLLGTKSCMDETRFNTVLQQNTRVNIQTERPFTARMVIL